MIKIVRGNDFVLKIPVETYIGKDENGQVVFAPFDFADSQVSLVIKNLFAKLTPSFSIEGNIISAEVNGNKIANGTYGVEIIVAKEGNMRSYKPEQFSIVESDDEADIFAPAEFETVTAMLKTQVFAGKESGSITDYNLLLNRPKINNIVLSGNKTLQELDIQPKGDYAASSDIPTKISQLDNDSMFVTQTDIDSLIGNIGALLDHINGEII